ncbi:ABC transporter ATP-binding protein [Mycoplasmatota bacterium]|nr:ABC transporter ATP-binding protein [Mycoplasmatota bacterium]
MLRLVDINFKYNSSEEVLSNFNLSLSKGDTLAILGPSGCGKSTILRIIAGLEKPSSGNVYINDLSVNNLPTEKRNIGFLFQEYALFPHMNVYDNIKFGLNKNNNVEQSVEEVANLVGVREYLKRYPHELSGGQRQRVALARAIIYKPDLLLLDEPFSNLDTDLKSQIRKDLKEVISKTNITTIIVTHDELDAKELADEIITL